MTNENVKLKVGDRVRLTGSAWGKRGEIVAVERVDEFGGAIVYGNLFLIDGSEAWGYEFAHPEPYTPTVGDLVRAKNGEAEVVGRVESLTGFAGIRLKVGVIAPGLHPSDGWTFELVERKPEPALPDAPGVWRDSDGDEWVVFEYDGELVMTEQLDRQPIVPAYAPYTKVED